MITSYKTITETSEGFYKEKGSKFYAFATPVETTEQVSAYLAELKQRFHDARHFCYAYILGPDAQSLRANDDGEPKHSAGDPILGQIKSAEITNTLIVVVRYFGGTKLGVSGLIFAYKTAAALALSENKIATKHIMRRVIFRFPYTSTNEIMKVVSDFQIQIEDQEYQENCRLTGLVKLSRSTQLEEQIDLLQQTGTAVSFQLLSDFI